MSIITLDLEKDHPQTLLRSAEFIKALAEARNNGVIVAPASPLQTAGEQLQKEIDAGLGKPQGDEPNPGQSTAGPAADGATGALSEGEGSDGDDTPGSETRVDLKGVEFNELFCSKAAKPFYASGKREGQWKKRQGVDEGTYDTWYAEALAKAPASDPAEGEAGDGGTVNTAAAFGAQNGADTDLETPEDLCSLMRNISELQTAERLTADDIPECYQRAGVEVSDLLPPVPAAEAAPLIAKVWQEILQVI